MTIDIRKEVPTLSSAIRLMVAGLKEIPNDSFIIDMDTFGDSDIHDVCYGCAATCAIQQLADKRLDAGNIMLSKDRAGYLGFKQKELSQFEAIINCLRENYIERTLCEYFGIDDPLTIGTVAHLFEDIVAPLESDYTQRELDRYITLATKLEEIGL